MHAPKHRRCYYSRYRYARRTDLAEILESKFSRAPMQFPEGEYQAAPMLQPVGGMDRVVGGFMKKVGHLVKLDSRVSSLRLLTDGVEIACQRHGRKRGA